MNRTRDLLDLKDGDYDTPVWPGADVQKELMIAIALSHTLSIRSWCDQLQCYPAKVKGEKFGGARNNEFGG
jgi:hypothetical protein